LRLLALFDRPEDDLLLCAGTLALYADEGAELTVVAAELDDRDRLRASVRKLGNAQLIDLGHPEGDRDGFEELLADLFRSCAPDLVLTPAPRPGAPPDSTERLRAHACSSFFSLVEAGELKRSKLYHRAMPAGQLTRAVRQLKARGYDVKLIPLRCPTTPDTRITSIVDVSAQLTAKLRVLRSLVATPDLFLEDIAPLFGQEFFSRAYPHAWVTGVIERDLLQGFEVVPSGARQTGLAA
jgi:LmbE family N-acetylglucosaminyl deacetylase